jgi:hypothetical protein
MTNRMESVREEIKLGAVICERLRIIYFNSIPWINCYKDVAAKFRLLKESMINFYSEKTEKDILIELNKFSDEDIKDALNIEKKVNNSPKSENTLPKYENKVTWIPVPAENTEKIAKIRSIIKDNK